MKILFIKNQLIFPVDCGGNIRVLNILRYLAKWHEVTYLCNSEELDSAAEKKMGELGMRVETVFWKNTRSSQWKYYFDLARNLVSPIPFNVAKVSNPELRKRALELLAESDYDLLICDFVQMAQVAMDLGCRASLLFQHNVEAQIFERHAKNSPGWIRRCLMKNQWRKMRHFEAQVGRKFDRVIAVSEQDRQIFENNYHWQHVEAIDTAVDTEYYVPQQQSENPNRVVFVSSLDWLPNQDGAEYFVNHVWPKIRQVHPKAIFQLVGRNPSCRVQRLANVDGVFVVGAVPDVRPYLAEAAVVVVPLLVGGGTRLKIFEAMAMGKAVVSTSIGAEGLKVDDQKHLLLANAPETLAEAVNHLLANPEERQRIGQAARDLVDQNFTSESIARQFERICKNVVNELNPTPPFTTRAAYRE